MKKIITLALLAGLLTVSLSACFTNRPNSNDPNDRSSIFIETSDASRDAKASPSDAESAKYIEVTGTQYAYVKNPSARLYNVEDTDDSTTVDRFGDNNEDELLLLAVSENRTWSKVKYNKKTYYVLSSSLSTADLLGHNFRASSNVTMYVYNVQQGGLNLRKYPTTETYTDKNGKEHDLAPVLASLSIGSKVTVAATSSTGWYKVRYGDAIGYIFSDYLSTNEPISLNTNFNPYTTLFSAATTMYVSVEQATVRKIPSSANISGSWVGSCKRGDEITVIGKVEINDTNWYAIQWTVKGTDGRPDENIRCYIHASCLSSLKTGAAATLEDYLEYYPTFKKYERTLYVSVNGLNARSAPEIPASGEPSNVLKQLNKKDKVEVKALGTYDGSTWALVQDLSGYFFVSFNYLTADAEGNAVAIPLTLSQILAQYTNFKECSKTGVANADAAALNVPSAQDGVKLGTVKSGATVKIVAEGYVEVQLIKNYWYVIQVDGTCYFVGQSQVDVK